MKTSFNLTRQFGLFSSVSIFLITLISGYTLSNFLTEKLLLRDASLTQEFVDSIIETDEIWQYFISDGVKEPDLEFQLLFLRN